MTKSFDHLLRETLKAPAPEPADGCLDAGVLAAWFEGTLDSGERAAAEAHAAECPRCQAALAAMIRIEPALESRPWWRAPAFGWLVPITVAAAALVIVIQPSWRRTAPQVAVQQAPTAIAPAGQPASQPAAEAVAVDSVAPKVTPPPPAMQARTRDGARSEALAKRQAQAKAEATASPSMPPLSVDAAPLKDRVGVPVDESTLQRAASAAAASAAPEAVRERGSVVAAGTPPVAAAAPARPAEDRSVAAPVMAEKAFAETVMLNARAARADEQRQIVIQGPGGSTRWRIATPGSVQRSHDAGRTWETQTTGGSAVITNGAAPSASVCWLVGKGGVVLQSVDGRTWRRVPFPQAVDLVAISAADERTATVSTIDGRTFTTADAGKTWK